MKLDIVKACFLQLFELETARPSVQTSLEELASVNAMKQTCDQYSWHILSDLYQNCTENAA